MDIHQYASHPSDPLWEQPRWPEEYCITIKSNHRSHDHGGKVNDNDIHVKRSEPGPNSPRGKALMEAANQLTSLCGSNAPVADVQGFLAVWEDPSSPGRLQPNALAWFSDSRAIQWACNNDNRDVVRLLLEKRVQPTVRAVPWAKKKYLETKNRDVLKLLVLYGLDINQPVNDHTPPMMSMLLADEEMVRWLLSQGADPGACSPLGDTMMQRAASYAPLNVLKLLVEHGGLIRGDLVARASYYRRNNDHGFLEVIQFLLDHGAPIDAYFAEGTVQARNNCCLMVVMGGQNALHFAIGGGKRDLVKLLLKRGADRNLTASSPWKTKGKTVSPVELARMCGHEDIVDLLDGTSTETP